MSYHRHHLWNRAVSLLDNIAANLGGKIYDNRCGKYWDVGQAICAEAYGPNWNSDPVFLEWNQKDDTEPPEPHYLACAEKMAAGYVPEWTKDAGDEEAA